MFLLKNGLLTLIYNASLIVLMRFWSYLPHNTEIIYGDIVTSDVIMVKYLGRGPQVFSELLSKGS